jgi:ABC-type nitrate/sulfonate/bicarbonate transport system substrate-binding protein
LLVAILALAAPAALATGSFPPTLPLPNGWQPTTTYSVAQVGK